MGLLGRAQEREHPGWREGKAKLILFFCVFLPLYHLVVLLAKQAGFPMSRTLSLPPCIPRLANLGASGL